MKAPLDVRAVLAGYTSELLRKLCVAHELEAASKPEMLAALARLLADPARVVPRLQRLETPAAALLHVASERPDAPLSVRAVWLRGQMAGLTEVNESLITLLRHGYLLLDGELGVGLAGADELTHPAGARALLLSPAVRTWAEQAPLTPVEDESAEPPASQIRRQSPVLLLREAELVAAALLARPLGLTRAGRYKTNDVKALYRRVQPLAPGLTPARIELLLDALRLAGVASADETFLRLPAAGEAWLADDVAARADRLLAGFLAPGFDPFLLEYYHYVRGELSDEAPTRRAVLRLALAEDWALLGEWLAALPCDVWVRLRDVGERLAAEPLGLFFRRAQAVTLGPADEAAVQAWRARHVPSLLAGFVEEVGAPLGLLEWAIGAQMQLMVRLTPFGEALCRGRESAEILPRTGPAIVVQPDFDVIAFEDRLRPDELARVLRGAALGPEENGHGPVWRLKLTRESLASARELGEDTTALRDFYERLTGSPLPGNVRGEWHEWTDSTRGISLWRGYDIVEFRQAAAADAAQRRSKGSVRVGERFLLVPEGLFGAAPVIDYDTPFPPSLSVDAEGRIERLPNRPADLGLMSLLTACAEQDESLTWWLRPALVTAYPGGAAHLLEELGRRADYVPPVLQTRLLALGGGFKPLHARSLFVIDVPPPRLLAAILANPALRTHVFQVPNGRTLLVAPDHYLDFVAELKRWNLNVQAENALSAPANLWDESGDLAGFAILPPEEIRQALENAAREGRALSLLVWRAALGKRMSVFTVWPCDIEASRAGGTLVYRDSAARMRHELPLEAILSYRPV